MFLFNYFERDVYKYNLFNILLFDSDFSKQFIFFLINYSSNETRCYIVKVITEIFQLIFND